MTPEAELLDRLRSYGAVAVALSGGVDSAVLLAAAVRALGSDRVLALHAVAELIPAVETATATALARTLNCRLELVTFRLLDDDRIAANPPERCYFCKKTLFTRLRDRAVAAGFPLLADGANLDDAGDYRPGARAAGELGILHPLAESGFDKAAIRELATQYRLPNAETPAAACLATRIPYGTRLTAGALRQVEQGESYLARLGCRGARVRHYGGLAKLELAQEDFPRVLADRALPAAFRELGFAEVALDLAGYRRGALNEALPRRPEPTAPQP